MMELRSVCKAGRVQFAAALQGLVMRVLYGEDGLRAAPMAATSMPLFQIFSYQQFSQCQPKSVFLFLPSFLYLLSFLLYLIDDKRISPVA